MRTATAVLVAMVAAATATAASATTVEPVVPPPAPVDDGAQRLTTLRAEAAAASPAPVDGAPEDDLAPLALVGVNDTQGDVSIARGDLTRVEMEAESGGEVVARARVATYSNPETAPAWVYGITGVLWYIDTDSDGTEEYYGGFINTGTRVAGAVNDASDELACSATPSWSSTTATYSIRFPVSCIGNPNQFRFQVVMLFDDFPTLNESIDYAPNTGWSSPVAVDGEEPPPPPPPPPSDDAVFTSVSPRRVFDTRTGAGGVPAGIRAAGSTLEVRVTGRNGVPSSGVAAVSLNVTAVDPTAAGYVTVFPCGSLPDTSNVNFAAGDNVPNAVIAPVSSNGRVCFYTSAPTHLIADVSGWLRAGSTGFRALTPKRVFDTRTGSGGVPAGLRPSGSTLKVKVTGRNGVPSSGVGAVALNVTATGPIGTGFVTVYPCGTRPNTSSLNYVAGTTVPNAVLAPVSSDGHVCFYVETATHLLADVSAWFSRDESSFRGITPARLADTRVGSTSELVWSEGGVPDADAITDYITGGTATTIDQVPWQVRVIVGPYLCGGSLVHPRWVVTAAHCTVGFGASSMTVHAGITYMSQMNASNGIAVRRVIEHPGHVDEVASPNDIALLELDRPATAGTPIALFESSSGPARGTDGVVSGWGDTVAGGTSPDQLRSATVEVRAGPGEPCGSYGGDYISSLMLCASGGVNAGACSGDSGGPLAINSGGTWRLAGVVSWGRTTCANSAAYPTVFTRVSAFADWIASYVPGLEPPPPPPPPSSGKIGGARRLEVQVTGRNGIPASGVAAVSLNLTVTEPEGAGYATVYPCGSLPDTSSVNYAAGQTRANAVITPVSSSGKICVYSYARTHAIVDVNGWFPS